LVLRCFVEEKENERKERMKKERFEKGSKLGKMK
jgi:hypothetical protein